MEGGSSFEGGGRRRLGSRSRGTDSEKDEGSQSTATRLEKRDATRLER